ncbi:MAG: hypothetical protein ACYCOR_18040 [Acidobacteriaceae bacterium]
MGRSFAVFTLSVLAIAQVSFASARSGQDAGVPRALASQSRSTDLADLPALPRGKSTVEGGTIRDVDPVRDQLSLKVYGAKPMKILFDERTQVYRDGVKTSLSDLHAEDHASVETVLDGTKIFALSIHMLSRAPEGECQGQVLNYDASTGQLTMAAALSGQPIELRVPAGTPIVGVGQFVVSSPEAGLSNLVKHALISVKFQSSGNGRGVATQISILAAPGSSFVFTGNVAFLDLSSNRLVLVDPQDNQRYPIVFDPNRFPMSRDLHVGTHLSVTTTFDGSRYIASAVKIN